MEKLRKKRMFMQGVSAVCNMGGTWMVVVTVCQIVQSAERTTVGGFVLGMLAALAYGLCALLCGVMGWIWQRRRGGSRGRSPKCRCGKCTRPYRT